MNSQQSNTKQESTTHFGFEQVAAKDKVRKVAGVFDSVADQYDVMNDLMSLGVHRIWKRVAIEYCGLRSGHKVLDLAAGTGDLTKQQAKQVGSTGQVISSDINRNMLANGRRRLVDLGIIGNVNYAQANAEFLPFPNNHFNCVTIAFGLRNVTNKSAALTEMYRVLKPGGRLVVLEFSEVTVPPLKSFYDFYSFKILPTLGKLIANDADSYRYLAESIRMHPDQETLKSMMQEADFERCDYTNMSAGIVALHRGYKL